MSLFTIVMLGIGLAMDAFAVALSTGVALCTMKLRHAFRMAAFFGVFQAIMPIAGWSIGRFASGFIKDYDHWIAFGLLLGIGGKMIYESLWGKQTEVEEEKDPHNIYILLTLALATSIDAAAVGVSLSFLDVPIVLPSIIIGVITFFISLAGAVIGCRVGNLFGTKVEILGGLVLIGIGIKILVQHIGSAAS